MIKSMTGFGKQVVETDEKSISIEIRSLNSKQLDLYLKIPQAYRNKELVIREQIGRILKRGKVEVAINVTQKGKNLPSAVNIPAAKHYYQELNMLAESIDQKITLNEVLSVLLKMPDVLSIKEEEIDADEWSLILSGIEKAALDTDEYRLQEGQTLADDLRKRIHVIIELLPQVDPFEIERTQRIKERIAANLEASLQEVQSDKNRLEQEMIYYIQKLDITEEKIRLQKHCEYFLETLESGSTAGKKLGFIGQEIGREINTLGSKANDVGIQKIVVLMKDELEKIKEQLFNIL